MTDKIRFDFPIVNHNLNNMLSDENKRKIILILKEHSVFELYTPNKEIVLSCYNVIAEDTDVLSGHKLWKKEYMHKVKSPDKLPRIEENIYSKKKLYIIEIKFIDTLCGGMGSFYGFNGYYLSAIFDLDEYCLLDIRGENAK